MHVGEALRWVRQGLQPTSDSPGSDARLLLADTLGTSASWVLSHDGETLAPETEDILENRLQRLVQGEPLPYVLGWWEFYGRRFSIGPSVLIPRPETELLVERALDELRQRGATGRVIDMGTGSGCLAVTLACESPTATVAATDISREALTLARANAVALGVSDRVRFVQASLFDGLAGTWDVVCANLPYIPSDRLPTLSVARHEPALALDGGPRGTEVVGRLLGALPRSLAPGGLALLEIDSDQAVELTLAARESLPGASIEAVPDLAGAARMLVIRRSDHDR